MGLRLIRLPEVRSRVGYSPMHLWRLEKAGRFPRRVKLGPNAVAWVEEEITAWCEARIAERDTAAWQTNSSTSRASDKRGTR